MRPFLCHNPDPDLSHCILPFEKKTQNILESYIRIWYSTN